MPPRRAVCFEGGPQAGLPFFIALIRIFGRKNGPSMALFSACFSQEHAVAIRTHKPTALAAAEAGKAILCEKPMDPTVGGLPLQQVDVRVGG